MIKENKVYGFKVINKFRYFIRKALPITSFLSFSANEQIVCFKFDVTKI